MSAFWKLGPYSLFHWWLSVVFWFSAICSDPEVFRHAGVRGDNPSLVWTLFKADTHIHVGCLVFEGRLLFTCDCTASSVPERNTHSRARYQTESRVSRLQGIGRKEVYLRTQTPRQYRLILER